MPAGLEIGHAPASSGWGSGSETSLAVSVAPRARGPVAADDLRCRPDKDRLARTGAVPAGADRS